MGAPTSSKVVNGEWEWRRASESASRMLRLRTRTCSGRGGRLQNDDMARAPQGARGPPAELGPRPPFLAATAGRGRQARRGRRAARLDGDHALVRGPVVDLVVVDGAGRVPPASTWSSRTVPLPVGLRTAWRGVSCAQPVSPQTPPLAPFALVQDGGRFLLFEAPLATIEAREAAGVCPALEQADAALAAGRFVAGFLAYEAAAAFGFATRPPDPDGPPLVWLGVFEAAREVEPPRADPEAPAPSARSGARARRGRPRAGPPPYPRSIARGDTYQVNFTFPSARRWPRSRRRSSPALLATQRSRHGGARGPRPLRGGVRVPGALLPAGARAGIDARGP